MTQLAKIYEDGKLLPRNDTCIYQLTLKAANLGDSGSAYKLATLYKEGIGVQKNIKESEKWYQQFSELNLFWHKMWAVDYLKSGLKNYKKAGKLLSDASNSSYNPWAISTNIQYSITNSLDYSVNLNQLKVLSENNNLDATVRLANIYYDGLVVEKNYQLALELYEKASLLGDIWNEVRIADMYLKGQGTTRNIEKALQWNYKAAEHGNVWAINNIVYMYFTKQIGNPKFLDDAISMLINLAEFGSVDAMRFLGDYYSKGYGVQININESIKWYQKAAKLGDAASINHLKELI